MADDADDMCAICDAVPIAQCDADSDLCRTCFADNFGTLIDFTRRESDTDD